MKSTLYLFAILLLIASTLAEATVIRVNNREESVPEENLYDNLQEAYDKAVANDTIYIEGSPFQYGSLTLTKRLTIIGPGYFLTENGNNQAVEQVASVGLISFSNDSENSKIIGISFIEYRSGISTNVDDITISNCLFGNQNNIDVNKSEITNLNISKCYFGGTVFESWYRIDPPINIYFANNVVQAGFTVPDGTSGNIVNNVFAGVTFEVGAISTLQIHNNVLLSTDEENITIPSPGSNISHNISSIKVFGTDNGNQENVLASQIFLQQGSTDGKWQIKADGPAAGTGREGVDIGAFGGPEPYRLSGLPSIPRVTDVSTEGFINQEGELVITIQATAK